MTNLSVSDSDRFAFKIDSDRFREFRIFKDSIAIFLPASRVTDDSLELYAFRQIDTEQISLAMARRSEDGGIFIYATPDAQFTVAEDDPFFCVVGRWAEIRRYFK